MIPAVPAVVQVMQVEPEAVAAAWNLAAVVVALQHGPAGGGSDSACEVASPRALTHLENLGVLLLP